MNVMGASDELVFDLAIIGYGPAGAVLANLLGHSGLRVCVLERDATIYPLPRAIHFDGEVMRIFQATGLRAQIEAVSRPGLKGMHFVNAAGETLMIRGGTAALGPHGSANNYYFHQPELEQVLRDGVRRYAQIDVRLQHEVMQITQDADEVRLSVRDVKHDRSYDICCRYVIGCDGGRSMVRRLVAQGDVIDLGLHQPWLVFDVLLNDSAPELPGHTVQHCNPARPMTYCNVTGRRRRWEIMLMPCDDPHRMVEHDNLWKLVSPWIKPGQAEIERAVIYTFHSIIARGWRKGRLLIAGDAAHQTPPFLGQGMCAAVRDVFNLAWKLEAVIKGHASDHLLDTYESERSPHVHAFIDLAVRLGDVIQATDPEEARARDLKFMAGPPEIFQFPAPRLGPGVLRGSHVAVGQPFPQPHLQDGHLLDELLGRHFAVLGLPAVLADVALPLKEAAHDSGVMFIAAQDEALTTWLSAQGVQAVVIRPDRYVMAVANSSSELATVVGDIPGESALGCP